MYCAASGLQNPPSLYRNFYGYLNPRQLELYRKFLKLFFSSCTHGTVIYRSCASKSQECIRLLQVKRAGDEFPAAATSDVSLSPSLPLEVKRTGPIKLPVSHLVHLIHVYVCVCANAVAGNGILECHRHVSRFFLARRNFVNTLLMSRGGDRTKKS